MSRIASLTFPWLVLAVSACSYDVPGGNPFDTEGTTGPEDNGLLCVAACQQDADCCLGGVSNFPANTCPGSYPNNWQCVAGACVSPGCTSDSQCPLPEMQACRPVGGVGTCVYPCDNDSTCSSDNNMPGTSCQRTDDNGNGFCSQFSG